jgi:hypothetical protein
VFQLASWTDLFAPEATLVAELEPSSLLPAHYNQTFTFYNFTFNPAISLYNFLSKIYRALHFARPTALSITWTSGSGNSSASLLPVHH